MTSCAFEATKFTFLFVISVTSLFVTFRDVGSVDRRRRGRWVGGGAGRRHRGVDRAFHLSPLPRRIRRRGQRPAGRSRRHRKYDVGRFPRHVQLRSVHFRCDVIEVKTRRRDRAGVSVRVVVGGAAHHPSANIVQQNKTGAALWP